MLSPSSTTSFVNFRDFNISKEEPILNGESVKYLDYKEIKSTLEYDMKSENVTNYNR